MRRFMIGTDWWTDCDDAVAMRLAAYAVKQEELEILGIVINACMEHSVASVDGFFQLEGVPTPPLGLDFAADDFGGRPPYQARLAKYAARYRANEDAEDAVRLYRRLLAAAETPLEMVEVGYLNAVAALLLSEGDDISPLTGRELVASKVSRMWIMAGKWDEPEGRENNFSRNGRAAAAGHIVCRDCPVPITFLGFEVGQSVISGDWLRFSDPLHAVLCDHKSPDGRSSWDPMLLLAALAGDPAAAGYDEVKGYASVDPETGVNTFRDDPQGPHGYLVKQHEDEYYAWQINIRLASSSARIRRRRVRRKAKKTSKNGLYLRRFCDIIKM